MLLKSDNEEHFPNCSGTICLEDSMALSLLLAFLPLDYSFEFV